jgi:hypothetical protein
MGAMDLATAKAMVENYTVTRRMLIDNTYGINDTKAIWFSMDQVNAFVASLTPDNSGVRIYLGVYDAADPTYPNQTTVIAIGTTLDASGNNVDPIGQSTAQMLKIAPAGGGGGSDPFNHGYLCPPNTDCN